MKLNFDTDHFLANIWQIEPAFITRGIEGLDELISAEVLAGLALEDFIESRIIIEQPSGHWQSRSGPFLEEDFKKLPESGWTLLVQDVEKHLNELQPVRNLFSFIPRWRFDDLMISYATDGGSVGPHTDQYDVFLIQLEGKREWKIASHFDETARTDSELHLINDFDAEETFIADKGDILYLPPNVAHYGRAIQNCLTLSVGFRAPSIGELAEAVIADVLDSQQSNIRFTDPGRKHQADYYGIASADMEAMVKLTRDALCDERVIQSAILKILSTPKSHFLNEINVQTSENVEFVISPYTNLFYCINGDKVFLSLNGEIFQYAYNNEIIQAITKVCEGDTFRQNDIRMITCDNFSTLLINHSDPNET